MTSSYKVIGSLRRAAAIVALPLALVACGGGGGGSSGPAEPPPAAVTPLPSSLSATVPATAEPGAAVTLKTALAAANDLRYAWTFGDGGSSSEAAPAHAWAAPGRYAWALTVSNGGGQSVSTGGTLQVGWFERLAGAQCSGADQSGWCWQGTGSEPFATDVHCADGLHCVAVGVLGQVASTSDGGRNWALSRVPSGGETLTRVRMADADIAYAFGVIGRTVWRSGDGGKTWALAAQPATPLLQSPFGDRGRVWTLDAQTVMASANSSWISRDGGSTWTELPMRVDGPADDLLFRHQGVRILEFSSNGGSTWTALPKAGEGAPSSLGRTLFFDARQGLSARGIVISRTTDGGWSWQPVSGLAPSVVGDRLQLLADGSALLLGDPAVHRSTDRGQTWSLVPTPGSSPAFFDGSRGWAATSTCTTAPSGGTNCVAGLQRTTDGGQTWQAVAAPAGVRFIQRLAFVSATEGVLQAFDDGSVWWTADGGQSWTRAATLDAAGAGSPTLAQGQLTSDRSGTLWMLGGTAANDVLLRSTDHGRNWRAMALPMTPSVDNLARLKDVASLDGQRVWAVGRGGLVLASSDGGAQWRAQASGTLLDLDAVSVLDAQTAWITAASGELVFTTSTGGD